MNKLGYEDRIPRLLAYFEDDNDFFLVQELIEGKDLSHEIILGRCLDSAEVTNVLIDILEVLAVIQKYNVIHRDIKPSNLMRRNKDGKIVAIDFGSVKQVTTQVVDTKGQVRPTVAVGTEAYMPIEQMMGHPGFYSDIYAVGVIAIQALSGIVPRSLAIDNDGELIWRVRLPDNLAQSNLKLLDIIDKMVRYRCQERYGSAVDVLNELRSLSVNQRKIPSTTIITDSPVVPPSPQAEARINQISSAKPNRKPRSIILATSAIVALGGLAAMLLRSPDARTPDIAPQELLLESYENRDYGFKIDYPKVWTKEQRDDFFTRGVLFSSSLDGANDNFEENVSILVENLAPNTSIDGYTNDSIQEIKKLSDPSVTAPQSVSIANKMGKTVTYQGEENGQLVQRRQTWTVNGDRAYILTYTATPEQFDTYLPTVEKMLESFTILAK
jgi:serine/threonine-protein kinase